MDFHLIHYIFLFIVFSMLGWILEAIYRSLSRGNPVNPGFLKGPYVPIYGLSGILILFIYSRIHAEPLIIRFFIYSLGVSMVEYFAGEIMLVMFRRRWWDYSRDLFNVQGHICLGFSLVWGVLSLVCERVLYPVASSIIIHMHPGILNVLAMLGMTVMMIDLAFVSGMRLMPAFHKQYRAVFGSFKNFLDSKIAPQCTVNAGNALIVDWRRLLKTRLSFFVRAEKIERIRNITIRIHGSKSTTKDD